MLGRSPVSSQRTGAGSRRWTPSRRMSSKVLAALALALIAMRIDLSQGLSVGYAVAVILIPVWFPVIREYSGARTLFVVGFIALGSGLWLTEVAKSTHAVSLGQTASMTVGLGGILCSVGVVLWARRIISDQWVAIWFGVGLLAGVTPSNELFYLNPWRFGYSFAITITVLALAQRSGQRWLELVAALGLTILSTLTDARSSFAILLLTVILVAWQLRPVRPTRTKSAVRVVVALGLLAVAVYNFGQAAILEGVFGEATRDRTLAQLDLSGSLILGGRPELLATLALMQRQPTGFGAGTLLNPADVLAAKSGMAAFQYDPNNGYVENFMFGNHVELHSIIGDLWVHFGIAGLVLAGVILFLLLRGIGVSVTSNTASAVLLFLAVTILWAMFFGPIYSNARALILLLGLAMIHLEPWSSGRSPGSHALGNHVLGSDALGSNPPSGRSALGQRRLSRLS
ncbi:O-antigen ligase family protein [Glaciibacter sp. 2TAF33]|uniref:O-antigen ligase family protein n=1 Tax=Glaciibacter sp. 2TAF33 TaxID=3233015 RepID=UPI003F8E1E79